MNHQYYLIKKGLNYKNIVVEKENKRRNNLNRLNGV